MALPTGLLEKFPRELRNLIYTKLWKFTPVFIVHYGSAPMEIRFGDTTQKQGDISVVGLPGWLMACKTFLGEGLEELDLVSTRSIRPDLWPEDDTYGLHYLFTDNPYQRPDTRLLHPVVGGRIAIWADGLRLSGRFVGLVFFCYDNRSIVRALLERIKLDTSLHTLRIQIWISGRKRALLRATQFNIRSALEPLHEYRLTLDAFEFKFIISEEDRSADYKELLLSVPELKRLGRSLVGEGGALSVQPTYENGALMSLVLRCARDDA
jgi:hypothetical protein